MTLEQFFSRLWDTYPKDLLWSTKGGKTAALESVKKHIKPEEYQRVLNSVHALAKYDRECKQRGLKVSGWPMLSTFINQRRDDREIDGFGEIRERQQLPACTVKDCDNEVHGPQFSTCTEHYLNNRTDRWYERRAKVGIELGLMPKPGETRTEWVARCRQMGRPGLQKLKSGQVHQKTPGNSSGTA